MAWRRIYCTGCDQSIQSKAFSAHLRSKLHKNNNAVVISDCIEKLSSAFSSRIAGYRISSGRANTAGRESTELRPPAEFLRLIRQSVRQLIDAKLAQHINIKANFELFAELTLPKNDLIEIKSFATENINIHQNYNFNDLFANVVDLLCKKFDDFQERDSGWTWIKSLYLEVNINKYTPLRAASYIDLPKCIKSKRACINIKNNDNFCFL